MKKFPEISLSKGIKWSFAGHVSLFLFLLLKSAFFTSKAPPYIPTLKVDLVALPDVLKKDQLSVRQTTAPKAEEHPKPTEVTQSKPDPSRSMKFNPNGHHLSQSQKNREALQRLRALTKIQNWGDEAQKKSPPHLYKGNRISPGNSSEGEEKESPASAYYDELRDRLNDHFELPPWVKRQSLSARVQLYIAASGQILKHEFENHSGNSQFDLAVVRAIEQSSLPKPPFELSQKLMRRGILVRFPL